MKKRRVLTVLIMAALLAFSFFVIFAGNTKDEKEGGVIRVWKGPHTGDDAAVFADVIAAFEAEHPGATVEYTPTPWDTIIEKYTTAFASGNPPDIIYAFTGGYVDGVVGQCYDLREIYDDEGFAYLKKGVADSLLAETTVDGKLVAIPYFTAGASFVYNIDLLKDAGFDRPPDTIEELVEYAKAMTKDLDGDGKIDQYGYGLLSYDTAEAKPDFNMGVSKLPQGPGKGLAEGRGTYAGSGFWSIAEATKHLELAKDFVLKLYDPEFQKPIAMAFGFIPSNTNIKMDLEPIPKAFADVSLNYGVPYRFGPHVNEVKEAVWRAMQGLQSGAVGPEDAWEQAVSEGKAALQ
ncbi:MAG TPA: extracellular solute-binding protein [Spirochaetes bacterium]|nr:extracellular solute-binding protein [Spirochaetota bacterium]